MSGTTSPAVNTGTWHLVTYTDTGTAEMIYVDGVPETTTQGFTNGDLGNQIRFGIGGTGEADGNLVSNGSIGAINIYASALTGTQIQALYASNVAALSTANILPSTSPVTLTAASATLDLESVNQTLPSLTGPVGSALILGLGSNLTIKNTTSSEFDGSVTGNGSITEPNAGTFTLGGATVAYTGSTNVGSGAIFNLAAGSTGSIVARDIGAVTIASAGKITLAHSNSTAGRQVLVVPSLTLAGGSGAWTGSLDLNDNDMIVQGAGATGLAVINNEIQQGYHGGNWQGSGGIISSVAAGRMDHLTAIGVIQNDDGSHTGTAIYTRFDGVAVGDGDVLVKYTYYGDANLDGEVDGSDYTLIDNGFDNHLTGWINGDFNYDGIVDGSDYTLSDNAFNTQGAALTAQIAGTTAQLSGSSAVPEPAAFSAIAVIGLGMLTRRRV
jgi:hypothetical protein